jgi:predicted TIM-barrel fold metal-dependent hydrolase
MKDLAPVSQMLYGADVPIRTYELTNEGLDVYQGFSPKDWEAIYRGNAEKLFPAPEGVIQVRKSDSGRFGRTR